MHRQDGIRSLALAALCIAGSVSGAQAADKPATPPSAQQAVTQTVRSVPQLCQFRETQIVQYAAALNQKLGEARAEKDKTRQTQLGGEVRSLGQTLNAYELSWSHMDCARLLYPNGGIAPAPSSVPGR